MPVWKFYYEKKSVRIFLRQIKRIAHENFSVCLLNTKLFYHGLTGSYILSVVLSQISSIILY